MGEQINETVKQRKTNPLWSHLQVESEKAVLIETENRMVLSRGWRMGVLRRH